MRRPEFAFLAFLAVAIGAAGATIFQIARTQEANAAGASVLLGMTSEAEENAKIFQKLQLFGDILERIRANYVEKPDDAELIEGAIEGMLSRLDPHNAYLPPKGFRDMQVQTRGEFGGLGIEVTMENGVVKVVSPIEGTPAEKAGLRANDLITHLDGEQVLGLTLQQAVEKMRGRRGSTINLTIMRDGQDEPLKVAIKRDIIRINPVRHSAEGDDVGYIRVTTFNERTYDMLKNSVNTLKTEMGGNLKGYVIDLRNNPGGLLDQAIAVSDAFLDKGAIVITRGRNADETQRSNAKAGDLTGGSKVVVMINGGSASASEIVAGALQDHERATIIGTRSFGKGSVQTIEPLGANGALRYTTARYYTPSGRSIQAKGIVPDIKVDQPLPEELAKRQITPRGESSLRGHLSNEEGDEGSGSNAYVPRDREKDEQLAYALKLVRGEVTPEAVTAKADKPAVTTTVTPETAKN
ncbi:MAG: S41 family peptidase [Pseudomonadota bacterium]